MLHLAISRKNAAVLELIFALPKDVIGKLVAGTDSTGRTPLHFAAAFGVIKFKGTVEFNLFEELFKAGANPNAQTIVPHTAHSIGI